jgi:8-oxo-dGTP diphosphatase
MSGVHAGAARVVFHDRDTAAEVARLLDADGAGAAVEWERFQGEDDDEDHAWAVVAEVPRERLEGLAEEYDGWVDEHAEPPSSVSSASSASPGRAPAPLPDAPRRRHRR